MGDPNIQVKISVSDGSFEAGFSIPVSATPEQMQSFVKAWFSTLSDVLKLPAITGKEPG